MPSSRLGRQLICGCAAARAGHDRRLHHVTDSDECLLVVDYRLPDGQYRQRATLIGAVNVWKAGHRGDEVAILYDPRRADRATTARRGSPSAPSRWSSSSWWRSPWRVTRRRRSCCSHMPVEPARPSGPHAVTPAPVHSKNERPVAGEEIPFLSGPCRMTPRNGEVRSRTRSGPSAARLWQTIGR